MKTLRITIIVVLSCFIAGCGRGDDTAGVGQPTFEDLVIANCYTVQAAIEAFAAENNGEYPSDLYDRSLAGNRLLDLLPGGTRLENPFTKKLTEPSDFKFPVYPGQTVFRSASTGYLIVGFGKTNQVIISLEKNYSDNVLALENLLIANCFTLQQAVENWAAENGGVYPSNVDSHTTPAGNTVTDLLPGGILMENPFTQVRSEPVNGAGVTAGRTGYVPIIQGGTIVGYTINGWGRSYEIIVMRYDPIYCPMVCY